MFEHKDLDGTNNRLIPATEAFLAGEVLEKREGKLEPENNGRTQFAVVGDRLVERALPPESVGNFWSYDVEATPWWGAVNNPPHAGLVADFNSHTGGQYRVPLNTDHNVVAFAGEGEEVVFNNGEYRVTRKSDEAELVAKSILELRTLYYS